MRLARPSLGEVARPDSRLDVHQCLDRRFMLVGELAAVGAEELDAVVLVLVVRSGDHHAHIGAQASRQHGDGRRRQRAEQKDIHADGGEAGGQCVLDHVARKPRVLADHHAMAMFAAREDTAGRHAGAHGGSRRHGA